MKIVKKIAPFLILTASMACLAFSVYKSSSAETTFDHSQCQYPTRTTNPPDGCDNSDPACPAEIKGGNCGNSQKETENIELQTDKVSNQSVEAGTEAYTQPQVIINKCEENKR